MFKASNDHWKNLYANGFAWSVNGIDGLEYKGVKPYHVAKPLDQRNDEKCRVVYAIYEKGCEEASHCFFEDDYKECFDKYNELEGADLWVSYLRLQKPNDKPSDVWNYNQDYMNAHHGNSVKWSTRYNSWMF